MNAPAHPLGAGLSVTARKPDASAFAPFGAFLQPPHVGERAMFGEWLHPVAGREQQCHLNRVSPSDLPLRIDQVERHPRAAQVFLPVGVSRYLVVVMPTDESGGPDRDAAQAYVVPGTMGVAYRPGTWHAGIAVLDAEASFAVLMWRGGADDDEFAPITPIDVCLHAPGSDALTGGQDG